MSKAIQVVLDVDGGTMTASCIGHRSIIRALRDLPIQQPAHALAKAMCHRNGWSVNLVHGLLPNGDEVFCFRHSGR